MCKDRNDIISKPIYDKENKLIGNITGRKGEIERFNNKDLTDQLKSDRQKHKENLRR